MPGFLLHAGATVNCAHLPGLAQPATSSPRVKVGGQQIVVQTTQYSVTGCALTGTTAPPCATAQWIAGATRVRSSGVPVLLQDSQSICTPTGTPLTCSVVQVKVKGT